ncbi:DUF2871 domain-containing protein [Enterococcus dispar]|uniref:DUF2871 domain-containing protein n=1 Tax=Enterococcus dispar ATCC 51266 TaxID=1139219 RepID=S0KEF8_9ENTE|nr:DUF2871 domain-containing protein [Enterococcus dispar]EOT39290.1 hypothetical protein OMK_02286 [Enterococcus dispar ATCC 51266]EOW86295.1 hypothetical protein I569_01618 [Enterococcus dispar ATCC 51266]OJG39294.1 hypothetical protein RV01_GL001816 [Enterococcus dispar]
MKKVMNTAMLYFILAMVGGVFYREFTKFNDFTATTTLGVIHTHLLALGVAVFLLVAILFKVTNLAENKLYRRFYVLYNIGLPLMVIMMTIRGIFQVLGTNLSQGMNGMISGIAGLSHIAVAVALFMLLLAVKKVLSEE